MMKIIQLICLTIAIIVSNPLWADHNSFLPKSPATTHNKPTYGDNPSLGRVLLYKTGQGLQNLGDAIQRSSDNVSQRIKDNLGSADESATPHANTANNVNTPSTSATARSNSTSFNNQQTVNTPVITVPSNTASVPIMQGRLSQSSTGAATARIHRVITSTRAVTITPSNAASAGVDGGAKSYAIGTE